MTLNSPCKVNLLLNILGKRPDQFHELETVMQPVNICDQLSFDRGGSGIRLSCSNPELPTDSKNLVYRAAELFLRAIGTSDGARIHLEKKIPLAAGLGGGSGNAATTLMALNDLFGAPLTHGQLSEMAASLGSDIPFFLQNRPGLGSGRGEVITPLEPFPSLSGVWIILVHPGFGISTPWAYAQLAQFPEALNGKPGRAQKLISLLQNQSLAAASKEFYNSLEAPALKKYPILALLQEFFRENGASATLMSGSGSATFALVPSQKSGEILLETFKAKFGNKFWTAMASNSHYVG